MERADGRISQPASAAAGRLKSALLRSWLKRGPRWLGLGLQQQADDSVQLFFLKRNGDKHAVYNAGLCAACRLADVSRRCPLFLFCFRF